VTTTTSLVVCVFCAASEAIDDRYVALAADLGTALAARGHGLVSGGGSVSLMGAVSRAARAGGARTVGVIPRALNDREVADLAADELLVTGTMRERKAEMDARADAFIALPGGLGTLEELLEVWTARSLALHTKPVVILDIDGLYAPLRAQLELLVERGFVRPAARDTVVWTSGVEEALDACERPLPPPEAPSALVQAEERLESDLG
jgi:uncharacterized protein (TIGR00730 family)